MNTDQFVENYFIKLFSKCKGFRKKPKISGNSIIKENVPYDNKKVNTPDFLCVLRNREVIFEVFNASELFNMDSKIRFSPGNTIAYDITKQSYNKVSDKIDNNFNNINTKFRNPIILIINTDESSIEPLALELMINSPSAFNEYVLQKKDKKEIISAFLSTQINTKKAILFSNPFATIELDEDELKKLEDIFSKASFSFCCQENEDKIPIN